MNENNITNDLALNAYSVVEKSGVAIQILSVAPTSIELSYSTIDGNKPGEYGNYLAIWQSKSSIPWSKSPDTVQAVSRSIWLDPFLTRIITEDNPFILTYILPRGC